MLILLVNGIGNVKVWRDGQILTWALVIGDIQSEHQIQNYSVGKARHQSNKSLLTFQMPIPFFPAESKRVLQMFYGGGY